MASTTKKPKAKYQVGDIVVIENPEVFVRCGYPLDLETAKTKVDEIAGPDLVDILRKLGGPPASIVPPGRVKDSTEYDKALRGLAYAYIKYQHFGGNERRIHTRHVDDHLNRRAEVVGWRFVMTGDYYAPTHSSGGFWNDCEVDYEPGGLANQKRHRILTLRTWHTITDIEIEESHVRKLAEEGVKAAA